MTILEIPMLVFGTFLLVSQRPESCGNTEITVNDGNKKRILLVEA
jgi:hypothetical protein